MKFKKINKALADEFGKGKVEIRPYNKKDYEYVLWFKRDNPKRKKIKKAMMIVDKFIPSQWFIEDSFSSKR